MQLLDSQRDSGYLLHELRSDLIGNRATPGAGHEHARVVPVDPGIGFHPLQKLQRLLGLLGLMALIVLPEHLVRGGVDHDGLDRSRTHVESDQELSAVIVRVVRWFWRLNRQIQGSNLDELWTFMIVHYCLSVM